MVLLERGAEPLAFAIDLRIAALARAAPERLEAKGVQLVDELNRRQLVRLGQVVEAEEVEHRERAHDVHDGAALRGGANGLGPAHVDVDVAKHAAGEPAQRAIGLVECGSCVLAASLRVRRRHG
jgi:hypothetical protein